SSFATARLASVEAAETRKSSTANAASCCCRASRSNSGDWSSAIGSRSGGLSRLDLLSVDLLQARSPLEPRDLPLGRVALRDGEVPRSAELVRDRRHPLEQLVDSPSRGNGLPALEVEQLAGEAVADRAPEVLLEQTVRHARKRLPVVVRARAAC